MAADAPPIRALGVMSGTSMDAIDVAALVTDGEDYIQCGTTGMGAYSEGLRYHLLSLIADPVRAAADPDPALVRAITDSHCDAVEAFCAAQGTNPSSYQVIGFHGQTVFHAPERGITRQLFDGQHAANRLGSIVVCDFRTADVRAGGQGAPLAPLYHQARLGEHRSPVMILNLGGVANVTYVHGSQLLAFDTGPASAMMDDFVKKRLGFLFDRDGQLAREGQIDHDQIKQWLTHPYFTKTPPKSLDRNTFHHCMSSVDSLGDADGVATLAAFTIESIVKALDHVPIPPREWYVCGGGRHNKYIMENLSARLGTLVEPVEALGWNGDMLEAECFAWLAVRSLKALPLSLPTTTGVPHPLTGGTIHHPA